MNLKLLRVVLAAAVVGGLTFAIAAPAPAGLSGPFIRVIKALPEGAPAGSAFTVTVSCTGTGPFTGQNPSDTLNYGAVGDFRDFELPSGYEGSCTITETETSGATPSYECISDQAGAATCGGGGASPATLLVNDPSDERIARVTVTNTFQDEQEEADPADVVEATPNTTG